ncbi:MAG TPA: MerR family transcriptional regulator [Stellaceae bacterium]|jgi:DNA-binding transcriptional MerR regulator|nr:MerR family transcriptional regulator [Stellaceae bacterium]
MPVDLMSPPAADAAERASRRQQKSADAFRTISEVAQELEIPQHVLRFWESRFAQLRPLKRAGGRRYYRPDDVVLLRRIRQCLYDQGYTIKGVQKLLREGALKSEAVLRPTAAAPVAVTPAAPRVKDGGNRTHLVELRRELVELRDLLRRARR